MITGLFCTGYSEHDEDILSHHYCVAKAIELSEYCRGLRTALIEREDFAAGTSSRSTKLVHGGVRYLEKAVFSLDYGQLKLVFEALHERKRLLENAPHLCNALPIMTVST